METLSEEFLERLKDLTGDNRHTLSCYLLAKEFNIESDQQFFAEMFCTQYLRGENTEHEKDIRLFRLKSILEDIHKCFGEDIYQLVHKCL